MKTIARIAFVAVFVSAAATGSASTPETVNFDMVSSVTTVETVTVSGAAGINL